MPALTFKQKLVLSMMVVVSGITLAMLYIAERKLSQEFEARFREEFNSGFRLLSTRQEARLGTLRDRVSELATSVRFTAVLNEASREGDEEAAEIVYQVIQSEFERPGARPPEDAFRQVYDRNGRMIIATANKQPAHLREQLRRLDRAITSETNAEVGYLAVTEGGQTNVYEMLLTKIYDADDGSLQGTLLFGIPFRREKQEGNSIFGLWVENELQLSGIAPAIQDAIRSEIEGTAANEGQSEILIAGIRHSFFYRALNSGSHFPRAFQVSLQSLEPMLSAKRELRMQIAFAGALALAAALGISLILAGGLTAPIERLAAATHEIERGNFEVKLPVQTGDEVGRLTESFNDMAAGLLLREKYRSVLDMVADKKIAEDLIHGQIELGGEERQVSVLFCDIRGFTALTEHMEPKEVIEMLNQHFTPLTRIVYEHHGAVDKFVGDLIMAIFGAPKGFGNDLENAARCALKMIEERRRLNETGKYKINIGIGVASGNVVAGRMGSKDRLNYTVLGPRVNLASRLCSKAGQMEVVIDDITFRSIENRAVVTPTPELQLKGFAAPVQAYKLEKFLSENESANKEMVAA